MPSRRERGSVAVAVAVAAALLGAGAALTGCIEDPADPPHYGVFMGVVLVGEASGRTSWGPEMGGGQDPQGRSLWLRTLFVGPDLAPDFLDQPTPPFCMGFKWPAAKEMPNLNAVDAGPLTISGHGRVQYVPWGVQPMPAPKQLPAQIDCQRAQHPGTGLFAYGCNVDPVVGLVESSITDKTRVTVTAGGGEQIGGFIESGLSAPPVLEPDDSFDLNQIDPKSVTAAWKQTSAEMVVIELFAQLIDGAEMTKPGGPQPQELAQILCIEPASSGSKQIPAGALAILPKASGSKVVMIQTTLLATNPRQGAAGWGTTMVGLARGKLGISCRTASGEHCPAPPAP